MRNCPLKKTKLLGVRPRSSPKVFILITSDMMEGQYKLHTVSLENTDLGTILLHSQQYLPSYSSSPSPSQTLCLPKQGVVERCATRAPTRVLKTWFMPTVALPRCCLLFSIYCLIYWKAKAHKSSEYYCAVPHACIYSMTHKRERRASPCFHRAPEDSKGQSEQLANLY